MTISEKKSIEHRDTDGMPTLSNCQTQHPQLIKLFVRFKVKPIHLSVQRSFAQHMSISNTRRTGISILLLMDVDK